MNVDPTVQKRLLDLAAVDAELTRTAHRRRTLPESAELERLQVDRQARKDAAVAVEMVLDDLDRDIRKLETEVENVRRREDKDRALLAGGAVNAKQMTDLQHELESLTRRQGVLEDELLEVMERREASAADHDHAGAQLSQTEDEVVDAQRRRDDAIADLDSADTRCAADRSALLSQFPAELLAAYDRQRAKGDAGAALLQARRCGACRLELDRNEIARIAKVAADEVVRCDSCGAILVRTAESGL
ncbi:C4-type zinc ribbon domain-containing protein [Rhodococcus antarcticus]|uniref:C4-type zinc ribbon domain-containing protein n=1 Tax=Rhodococcus antarcticus TaxID=2987751 RepID=A0ABY6NX70_9NOCA|nr:C4-type zinc ribbon domain-containing protein [Rhodococcus antarcticus]UZJ23621.1 C4-type zinc ribbon domain-containing protein [Rhodococcus antarcticus]